MGNATINITKSAGKYTTVYHNGSYLPLRGKNQWQSYFIGIGFLSLK